MLNVCRADPGSRACSAWIIAVADRYCRVWEGLTEATEGALDPATLQYVRCYLGATNRLKAKYRPGAPDSER